MKRQSKGTVFDISIRGDELENNRIQLEHNLQNTELSFRLSSTSDDEHHDERFNSNNNNQRRRHQQHTNHNSVEYPRHISEPSLADDFPPFWANRSREQMGDEDTNNQMRAWSYRSGEDDEGISPYGGETVSTAAHHASAITINTGLGGGRAAARRDPSLSGAEYDPDRPLHAMIAGVNSKHSMFDIDPSKHQTPGGMTYDPLVVDSTAELDRILASGHAPAPPVTSRSFQPTPPTSSVSSSDSEGGGGGHASSRPKLTDHLRHVSFSPKRPRTAQTQTIHASPLARQRTLEDNNNNASMNMPTPRPVRRTYASSPAQPEVRLQPATPLTGNGSKFTRMARGINKELEATQEQLTAKNAAAAAAASTRPASAPPERNPFYDIGARAAAAAPRRTSARDRAERERGMDSTTGKIHLPDVTGLTSAVESPARPGVQYYPYKGDGRPRDIEARLLQTLSSVQGQLQDLEEENGISRRRVRELEMELEECKREVARERTRLFEREELLSTRGGVDQGYRGGRNNGKGKARAMDAEVELDDETLHSRYKEAVDEKKALEALITSLRSHLTRLTSELASHQALLTELRSLRDSDAQALKDKGVEIARMKEEVQRLAGEVEVLRGVVEEGLRERRGAREREREVNVESFGGDVGMSRDLEEEEAEEHSEEEDMSIVQEEEEEETAEETEQEEEDEDEGNETEEPDPFDPSMLQQSSPAHRADRTMRTDHATLGSSTNTNNNANNRSPRFVDEDELDDIAAEMEERRSNRSGGSVGLQAPGQEQGRRAGSVSPMRRRDNYQHQRATVVDEEEEEDQYGQQQQQQRVNYRQQQQAEPSTSRPSAPTPSHANKHYGRPQERNHNHHHDEATVEPETPFPQIRGEQLERLFFSAPEHNAKTCTVCYRRRRRTNSNESVGVAPSWSRPKRAGEALEDEGYEGSEGADSERPQVAGVAGVAGGSKGKQREYIAFSEDFAHWQRVGQAHGVPPQTVVARVIRELEDDFTHYKSIYVELADQYKVMDAASDVKRRNLLAKHLREVVDVLEQKGDQIASLYDLLEFKDKPVSESIVPGKATDAYPTNSWGKSTRRTTTTN